MDKSAVVILNYNGIDHLKKFLPSVVSHTTQSNLVVIDNNSQDQSLAFITEQYPQINVISLDKNYGFSGGYNRGLAQVEAEYFLLLNSDVEVTADWDQALIRYLETHPQAGICQPTILSYHQRPRFDYAGAAGGHLDFMGYPFCRGRIFNTFESDQGQYTGNGDIFWAGGACMAIRASLFQQLGGFDEDFFAHMEEIDLCWRSWQSGSSVGFVADARVYHLGGGTLSDTNPYKTYLNFRNGLALLLKNDQLRNLWWKIPFRLMLDGVAALRFLLTGSLSHFWAVIRADLAFLGTISKTWKKRTPLAPLAPGLLYNKMIIWQYFVRGKKTFGELP